VRRWLDDCGCHTGGEPGWDQAWRAPLRTAFDQVRDHAAEVFARRGRAVLRDPWAARDAYVDLVLGATTVERFAAEHVLIGESDGSGAAGGGTGDGGDAAPALVEALALLESQRHALLMYTSCGWFFNDLAGIETVQNMRYAACCLDALADLGEHPPVDDVLATLARARSNDPEEGDGRQVWQRHVDVGRVDPGRVAAHLAMTELLAGHPVPARAGGYDVVRELHDSVAAGGVSACAGRVALTHRRTHRTTRWAYAAVHLGGLELFGAVRPAGPGAGTGGAEGAGPGAGETGGDRDAADVAALVGAVRGGDRVTALLRLVVDRFGPREFGLESVLPGAGDELLRATADGLADRLVGAYDQLRSDNHGTLAAMAAADTALPAELAGPVELALARRIEAAMAACGGSTDPAAYRLVRALAREGREEGARIASPAAAALLADAVDRAVAAATAGPSDPTVEAAVGMVALAREVALGVGLDRAQERIHEVLAGPDLDDATRTLLTPLALRLGVAPRPMDLPA
jgi:hypothetical protein